MIILSEEIRGYVKSESGNSGIKLNMDTDTHWMHRLGIRDSMPEAGNGKYDRRKTRVVLRQDEAQNIDENGKEEKEVTGKTIIKIF